MRADPTTISYPKFEDEMVQSGGYMLHGPNLAQGPTVAHFDKASLGPAPWDVHLEIQGINPMTIPVGP